MAGSNDQVTSALFDQASCECCRRALTRIWGRADECDFAMLEHHAKVRRAHGPTAMSRACASNAVCDRANADARMQRLCVFACLLSLAPEKFIMVMNSIRLLA